MHKQWKAWFLMLCFILTAGVVHILVEKSLLAQTRRFYDNLLYPHASRLAWSPAGDRIAMGGVDDYIRIWDVESGEILLTLKGHTCPVISLAWSPDGSLLASGEAITRDRYGPLGGPIFVEVRIWDTQSGELLHTLEAHLHGVSGIAWNHDGTRLASAGYDANVCLWDPVEGLLLNTSRASYFVGHLAPSPDGNTFAVGTMEGKISIYDFSSGEKIRDVWENDGKAISSLSWNPDGTRLIAGSGYFGQYMGGYPPFWSDGCFGECLHIIDVNDGTVFMTLEGTEQSVLDVAWNTWGGTIASTDGGRVTMWAICPDCTGNGEREHEFMFRDAIETMEYSPVGRFLALGGLSGRIYIYDRIDFSVSTIHP